MNNSEQTVDNPDTCLNGFIADGL
ncbi:unnamed protein product, partial [Rotaria sp. Silwood1]